MQLQTAKLRKKPLPAPGSEQRKAFRRLHPEAITLYLIGIKAIIRIKLKIYYRSVLFKTNNISIFAGLKKTNNQNKLLNFKLLEK